MRSILGGLVIVIIIIIIRLTASLYGQSVFSYLTAEERGLNQGDCDCDGVFKR